MDLLLVERLGPFVGLPRTRGDGPGEGSHLASGLSEPEVETIVTALCAVAEPVETRFLWRPQLHDPADEMVLEAAINGAADALVSFNRQDFGPVPARFGIALLSPQEALRRLSPSRHRRSLSRLGHHPRGVPRRQEGPGGSRWPEHRARGQARMRAHAESGTDDSKDD